MPVIVDGPVELIDGDVKAKKERHTRSNEVMELGILKASSEIHFKLRNGVYAELLCHLREERARAGDTYSPGTNLTATCLIRRLGRVIVSGAFTPHS